MPLEAGDIASIDGASIDGPMHGRPLVALLDGRDCSVEMPIRLYLRGISARDLNHIVVQDDRNAAKHLSDEDERIGERIIASVALAVAPISDSPKPPPCRDIVAGIFDAGADYPAANSWSGWHKL